MSSDNKTLADVQPGGMVRLGDQDEKPPQELPELIVTRGDGIPLPDQAAGIEEFKRQCLRRIETEYPHLSAQPSPGGQDATVSDDMVQAFKAALARAQLPGKSRTYFLKDSELPSILREVLAARQPVEFERAIPTRRRESAVELLLQLGFVWNNQRWEDRRQPVGDHLAQDRKMVSQPVGEPVTEAWIVVKEHVWDHGDGGRPTLAYLWPYEFERRVYPTFAAASDFIKAGDWPLGFVAMQIQAPPAQAVDLAENMLSVLIEEGVLARNGRVFQKLRALIDSMAVGK
ncbi:hypothetical protein [Stenotrophomonas maltophilia]|uniref:hypothetical protein n=1 Tax=Stenotrophomonas maltophilia TaxID=40324 RepID=UPI001F43A193|nr:hypothetical protein [Stenotrophomonas maltophilia]MCF3524583.1 hypothetical protein [Stenotrophomonas maltophilia]MCF3553326.1 hypothetical protein [Stenotrophomonas maltophilia]